MNREKLFWASCIALIATAMSFAIRGDILTDFEREYVVPYVSAQDESAAAIAEAAANAEAPPERVKETLGVIGTVAFFSFGLAIFFGGPLVDFFGMGRLLRLAALCHIFGALATIFAPNYWTVVIATFVVGVGNGLVEAVCNPLIATLYPEDKTHRLTLFHAWFPGGIVIGGLLAFLFTLVGFGWQFKMALLLIPSVIYTYMVFSESFPPTERVASGVSFGTMMAEAFRRPLFVVLFVMMWFTAATELGPGAWIANIYHDVMADVTGAGILLLVWGNGLMYLLRQFGGRISHAVSPIGLIAFTAPFAALGLFLFRYADTMFMWFVAAALLYIGVAYWWPTMLGIATERCPKSGAWGLAVLGAAGSFSAFFSGPLLGNLNDRFGPAMSFQIWAVIPVIICVVFLIIYLHDLSRGGYRIERIRGDADEMGQKPLRAAVAPSTTGDA